jgi:putative NIF3 family GTP cyclohydrolase 1 type 2
MKAQNVQDHLRSLDGGWMDLENTVDTFKSGDPSSEVTGIAVGWMSYRWALERAIELGCNLFVTHEPTYWDHWDRDEDVFSLPGAAEKKRFIEGQRLVILRCHDLWDRYPGIGIPDSWAAQLTLGEPVVTDGYFRVYDVAGKTAGDVAAKAAQRTRSLGQEGVQLFGPGDQAVSRLAIGTGAITPFFHLIRAYRADAAICSDDGIACWRDGALAIDASIPMVVVNHPVSEEPGMINLARHLAETFPDVPVHHIPQGCMYQLTRFSG